MYTLVIAFVLYLEHSRKYCVKIDILNTYTF